MFCPFNILRYKFGVEYLKRSQKDKSNRHKNIFHRSGCLEYFLSSHRIDFFALIEIVKKFVVKLGEQKGEQPITFKNERTGWSEKKTSWPR